MKNEHGFTILELLTVLALTGLLSSIAAFNLKALENPLENSTTELIAFMKQAKVRAISTTSAYKVEPTSSGYIQASYSNRCSDDDSERTVDNAVYMDFPSRAYLDKTDWSICFGPRGLPDTNIQITIKDSDNKYRTIEIFLGGGVRQINA